jgi:transcriptional regulator with XRE-family HTH domain
MRKEMKLSLRQVSQQTEISIATLCRIERGEAKSLQSDKLLTLTEWMLSKTNFTKIEPLKKRASPVPRRRSPSRATPSPSRFLGPAAGDK